MAIVVPDLDNMRSRTGIHRKETEVDCPDKK
jgi:hypothetical protein